MLKCPICENEIEENSFTEIYIFPFNKQEYKKYECSNCDLHWWEPFKIIPQFYESEVFEGYIPFHEGIRSRIEHYHQQFFIHFPKDVKGRLLDVGCGDGVFLREAQKHGFEVWGIDFDSKSIEIAKRHLRADTLYAMSLEEFYGYAKENNLAFDVITFFEVLEHQDNPKKFLEMVKNLLKKDGYIVGSVPNRDNIFALEISNKLFLDHPPEHLLRFSKKSLENILKICGFQNIIVVKTDMDPINIIRFIQEKYLKKVKKIAGYMRKKALSKKDVDLNNELLFNYSFENLEGIPQSFYFKLLRALKLLRNFTLYPLALIYKFINYKKDFGSNLYFEAQKEG
jgi:SAM-dependent methyltransferase